MSYALLRDTARVAIKKHRCIWCGEPILIGDKYRYEESIYEGHFQHHHWHPECDEDSRDYFRSGEEEFMPYSAERPQTIKDAK